MGYEIALAAPHFAFLETAVETVQPPARRRSGGARPASSGTVQKFFFDIGGGLSQPVSDTHKVITHSYGFQAGAGVNFNPTLGLVLEADYDHFGFQGRILAQQSVIYDPTNRNSLQGNLDGTSHIWSLSLNPVYNLHTRGNLGAYFIAGVGFYHKTANFTVPGNAVYCNFFGACFQYSVNQTIDKYTSNAPGYNGGIGFTYKMSRFSHERLYAEARYVYMMNSLRPGFDSTNYQQAPVTATNYFPANSFRTTFVPVKIGVRF